MPSYKKADDEITDLVFEVMERYHAPLRDAGAKIDILMVWPDHDANGDSVGHAITVGGYAALACIKILSLKDRVARGFDAEMLIDADNWDVSSRYQRIALIDHELNHIDLTGKTDDAERPKMKLKKHDRQFGWFDIIANRHGQHSAEVRQFNEMVESESFKQCYFHGMEPEIDDQKSFRDEVGAALGAVGGKSFVERAVDAINENPTIHALGGRASVGGRKRAAAAKQQ